MEKPIVPEIPENKTPTDSNKIPHDSTQEKPIKIPDTKPGEDNPRNPKEDVV